MRAFSEHFFQQRLHSKGFRIVRGDIGFLQNGQFFLHELGRAVVRFVIIRQPRPGFLQVIAEIGLVLTQ